MLGDFSPFSTLKWGAWRRTGKQEPASFRTLTGPPRSLLFIPVRTSLIGNPMSAEGQLRTHAPQKMPLFDHLVDIGELLGQPRFAKTLNHHLRID